MSLSPVRLNHAVLFVADLARAERFYTEVLGMEVIAREPRADAAFLRLPRSGNHHALGLVGIGTAAGPRRPGIGLYHLAWQVDTIDELAAAREVLLRAGAEVMVAFTYYGHREKLRMIGREDDLEPLNRNALRLAKEVAAEEDA